VSKAQLISDACVLRTIVRSTMRAKNNWIAKMDLMQSKNVFLFSVHFAGAKTYFCKAKCSAQLHILLPMATAAGQHFLRSLFNFVHKM